MDNVTALYDDAAYRAVALTFVRYLRGDPWGELMAWASLLPVFVAFGGFLGVILFRRELQTVFFCAGLALSEAINQTLKHLLRIPRPPTCAVLGVCDSHGMPSSHSQYMCFFASYLTWLALARLAFSDSASRHVSALLPWPLAALTMWSRIYLGYHTLPQVVAGGCVGVALGTAWFHVVDRCLRPRFAAWSESPFCRYLCIKDDSHIPNVLLFEYQNSQRVRRELAAKSQ